MEDGEIRKQRAPAHPQNGQARVSPDIIEGDRWGFPDRRHRVMTARNRCSKAALVTPSVLFSLSVGHTPCQPVSKAGATHVLLLNRGRDYEMPAASRKTEIAILDKELMF